jgi:hypothetical protein
MFHFPSGERLDHGPGRRRDAQIEIYEHRNGTPNCRSMGRFACSWLPSANFDGRSRAYITKSMLFSAGFEGVRMADELKPENRLEPKLDAGTARTKESRGASWPWDF